MSDTALRTVRRAYDQGAASRLEWVSALMRTQPMLVELAAYCYDADALAALGAPPPGNMDVHFWVKVLPRVVRDAGMDWPVREVEVRAALCLAHVAADVWATLTCDRAVCRQVGLEAGHVDSGHLNGRHFDEVAPALNWAERAIAGRTPWKRLACEQPFGLSLAWLDYGSYGSPLSLSRMAIGVVASRLPGAPLMSLVAISAAALRYPSRDVAALPDRLASDLAPWVLGERDPVRERLQSRGQRPAVTRG